MTFDIDPSLFDAAKVDLASKRFNANLVNLTRSQPKWWEIGAAEFRRLSAEGKLFFPTAELLPSAITYEIESRQPGRKIPCRVFKPRNTKSLSRAVLMHIHGGGWTLGSETSQDMRMQQIADDYSLTCVNIGYRLAPEYPFPAGPEDCFDVAEWLVCNSQSAFGASLGIIAGDSAGAHLSLLTTLHLLQHKDPVYSCHLLLGLVLHYGCYSLRWLPSVFAAASREPDLVLSLDMLSKFRDALLGEDGRHGDKDSPNVSPLYADLSPLRHKLPPALFTCGTEDYLLDDTLFMSCRWLTAGGNASLEIVKGAPHGFMSFDPSAAGSSAAQGFRAEHKFITEILTKDMPI